MQPWQCLLIDQLHHGGKGFTTVSRHKEHVHGGRIYPCDQVGSSRPLISTKCTGIINLNIWGSIDFYGLNVVKDSTVDNCTKNREGAQMKINECSEFSKFSSQNLRLVLLF